MPAFQAINLEPEENAEEQIDTTKEIHVDEALKRFQTALRLHAQGPRSRDAAGAAYEELFESEIFKYKESKTEYDRAERQADGQPETSAVESFSTGLDIDAGGADGVAASLSQALYLSYKNRGQYFLDKLKDASKADPEWGRKSRVFYHGPNGREVIDNWTAALDQDPSDPELWRRASRFAASLGSARMKRYCLEAAIELDDDPAIMEVEPPSVAEGLAGEQLKDHLRVLDDGLALTHPIMRPWLNKDMPALLKGHLDPIPFLPDPTVTLTPPPSSPSLGQQLLEEAEDEEAQEPPHAPSSWADLGSELMKCVEDTRAALRLCDSVLAASKADSEMTAAPEEESKETPKEPGKQDDDAGDAAKGAGQGSAEKDIAETADGTAKPADASQKERSGSVPNRKRSQSVAGLPEGNDEDNAVEKRSKRVRRRDTAQAEEATDPSTLIAKQLEPYQETDQNLFKMTKNTLENLGAEDKVTLDCLDEVVESCALEDRTTKISGLAAKDLRHVLANFSEDTARLLLNKKEQATLGLSSFLEHAKSGSQDQTVIAPFNESRGLGKFAKKMVGARSWITAEDVVYEWVRSVSEGYASFKWSEDMKVIVVQTINRVDSVLYEHITAEMDLSAGSPEKLADLETVVPMLFELHIDIYERITNPSSVVDYATRTETKYRLDRWLDVASAYVRLMGRPLRDPLCARFLWASVMASSLADNPVREHILLMWTSLRDLLAEHKLEPINLPNNLVMPTISAADADREISKLTTMDFFLGLFQEEMESPVQVIETLEPVLNPSSVYVSVERPPTPVDPPSPSSSAEQKTPENRQPISESANQGLRDLWKFLLNSSTELRLFLWSRLGDAYDAIGYPTKRFSCLLRSIEMIVTDFEGETYAKTSEDSRRLLFMRTLKSLDELLIQSLSLALNDGTSFDIVDEDHIRSSASALARVSYLLHVASLCDDEARIGITTAPSNSVFQSLVAKLRDMQVRAWSLLYTLFKAGVPQQESTIAPENELADFLAAIHRAIGLRKYCKASNKIFLKMMRVELLKLKNVENWEPYLGQVLYDLYGLKLGVGEWHVEEHGCPHEDLEKRQTMQLVEKITILANRMPMKDLLKSDLKTTIDEMQQSIGSLKSTPQMLHNLRNFTELLKKPIHPLRLYQALRGGVSVDAVSVNIPETALARHGWFFLFGMLALTKFKGVDLNRRQTPGAIDDLRIGATFLRQQLQFTADRWDAWFRLAECFDYELDEAVLWSADKMNKDRAELVKFQRNAIHCYTLALSHSRNEEVHTFDGDALHDLYHKFGMRLYSSSREPFAMEPFQHSDQERFFIESMGAGTFKRILHDQMPEYKVWKFAAKLFRMAMERQPGNWKNPYMLSKCYWKMHKSPVETLDSKDRDNRITTVTVLETLKNAVEVAYNARKSRHSEPILEPHYKIVSVLHKMVMRGDLPAADAAATLAEQPFGIAIKSDDHYSSFSEPEDWEEYVIRNLVKLKDKDKSNWQHRIIMRHARILFDEGMSAQSSDGLVEAKAAFGILKESMFTKTMVMNVWKCDSERPGRHHVYTQQYTRFMTKLLVTLSDRTNLELVLRRLRKKGADFYHFTDLWQSCCLAYVKLLRQSYQIEPAVDDVFKSMSSEEFEIISDRISDWAAGEGPHIAAFDCMKDTIELKKLNANLMRVGAIDDLVNDCYSRIYADVAGGLPGLEPSKVIEERNHAKEVASRLEAAQQADSKPPHSLNGLLNAPSGQDGAEGTSTPQDPEKSEAPSRRRAGVRRPDILRKAEQAVVRSTETPKSATKGRKSSVSSGKRGSQTPNLAVSDAESEDEGPDAQVRREAGEDQDLGMGDGDGDGDGDDNEDAGEEDAEHSKGDEKDEADSEAGSIHDSADDESDLSDVPDDYDEEMPPGLRFPNLGRPEQSAETSGEEADSESEGDEPEREAEEEGEEGAEEGGEEEGVGETEVEGEDEDEDEGEDEGEEGEEEGEGEGDGEEEVEEDGEVAGENEDTEMGEADVEAEANVEAEAEMEAEGQEEVT